MLIRFALFLLLIAGAAAAARWTPLGEYLDRETLLATLGELRQAWWSPLLLIGLYAVLCPVGLPATPLLAAGGIVFGAGWGALYNYVGTLLGGITGYLLARLLGGELLHHFAGRKLRRLERQVTRHGFFYLAGLRVLPLPYPAVNFAMALAGIRFVPYALSTALGLIPTIAIWTYFYAALYEAAAGETAQLVQRVVLALALLLAMSVAPGLLARRARQRRYRQLLAERAARRQPAPSSG